MPFAHIALVSVARKTWGEGNWRFMSATHHDRMRAATVLVALVLVFETPTAAFACHIFCGRHRGCAPQVCYPAPPCEVLEECTSLKVPLPPEVMPPAEEAEAESLPAALVGMEGIRPTGFTPSFLAPTGGGAFGPGFAVLPSSFPGFGGGLGGGNGGNGGNGVPPSSGGGPSGPGPGGGPQPPAIPEPSTFILGAIGIVGLLGMTWRRRLRPA
jgi:hypothetical protein